MIDPAKYPALVLNADLSPLGVNPIETWALKDTVHAVVMDRVVVIEEYDRTIRSSKIEMRIPSVIALRHYQSLHRLAPYNRTNIFIRDRGHCVYCRLKLPMDEATLDHVLPKSRGGKSVFKNVVLSCDPCNGEKSNRLPREAGFRLSFEPRHPTIAELNHAAKKMKTAYLQKKAEENPTWAPYLLAA